MLPAPRGPRRPARPSVAATLADTQADTGSEDNPVGRITVHPAGYGFVALGDGRDVFIPAKYRGGSLDGDQVRVSTWVGVKGTEGKVDEVIARGRARLTGVVRRAGRVLLLIPDDPRVATDFGQVALDGGNAAHARIFSISVRGSSGSPSTLRMRAAMSPPRSSG